MNTFAVGRQAEAVAATFLQAQGYDINEQNYRTRECEIDIIASKHDHVYFVEVKYRRNERQGSGLEYITPKKLAQMEFAAESWLQENPTSHSYSLAAIEISGTDFDVTRLIESLT